MKFDKNKILTVVTADQAKVGQKGWFGETPSTLEKRVEKEPPKVLERVWLSGDRRYIFSTNDDSWSLFYPAPEPTYEERQAEWVAKNNVKVGTKVRFTKGFKTAEDGSRCCEHRDAKGIEGVVSSIEDEFLLVRIPSDGWAVPFTALDVIKEPTYEERQAEWIKENNVKAGTKVRVTRTFTEDEDGSYCWEHDDLVGMTGTVAGYGIGTHNLGVAMSDGNPRAIPYFALEVIKEPTYRPLNGEELNDLVGKIVVRKCDGNKVLVTGKTNPMKVRLGNDCTYTAEQLLELFTLDGKPCGIKE